MLLWGPQRGEATIFNCCLVSRWGEVTNMDCCILLFFIFTQQTAVIVTTMVIFIYGGDIYELPLHFSLVALRAADFDCLGDKCCWVKIKNNKMQQSTFLTSPQRDSRQQLKIVTSPLCGPRSNKFHYTLVLWMSPP